MSKDAPVFPMKMAEPTPMDNAYLKARRMTDEELKACWEALRDYDHTQDYGDGVTMDCWAEFIYAEMTCRGFKTS